MDIHVEKTPLRDLVVITPPVFEDDRGFFMEVFRQDVYGAAGLPGSFAQLNHSKSARGVLRGLHFQWDPPMGKLMRVTRGTALLIAVDIRKGSPTLGKWYGVEVSESTKKQVWAPAGFARGFYVLSDTAEVQYLCTGIYNPKSESGILWSDPKIGIAWPEGPRILSKKDSEAQTLDQWLGRKESEQFRY